MMMDARFTENETGLEVLVSCPIPWGNTPKQALVKYPDGSVYSIPDSALGQHFTCVAPQSIEIRAYGGTPFMRPTAEQRKLDAHGNNETVA